MALLPEPDTGIPADLVHLTDFLRAWGIVQTHGIAGLLQIEGLEEIGAEFVRAMEIVDAEVSRLEALNDEREARRRAAPPTR